MHRLWHQLLRKFRLLSRREQAALVAMALLGLGAIGWVAWTEFATVHPDQHQHDHPGRGCAQGSDPVREHQPGRHRAGLSRRLGGELPRPAAGRDPGPAGTGWRRCLLRRLRLHRFPQQERPRAADAAADADDRLADPGRRQPLRDRRADQAAGPDRRQIPLLRRRRPGGSQGPDDRDRRLPARSGNFHAARRQGARRAR